MQAYLKDIVLPNKHKQTEEAFYEGHLLESETYVGGHVESIECGIFRSDLPVNFVIDTKAIDDVSLLSNINIPRNFDDLMMNIVNTRPGCRSIL